MRFGSITFKTFLFTAAVIMFVSTATLVALSLALPGYYEQSKHREIVAQLEMLAEEMGEIVDVGEARERIALFCTTNNATVWSFVNEDEISTDLSSPFVTIAGEARFAGAVRIAPPQFYVSMEGMRGDMVYDAVNVIDFQIVDTVPTSYELYTTKAQEGQAIRVEEAWTDVSGVAALAADETLYTITLEESWPETKVTMQNDGIFIIEGAASPARSAMVSQETNGVLASRLAAMYTLQPINEANGVILSLLPYVLLMNLVVAVAVAYLYSKMITKPILSISNAAEQMRDMEEEAESTVQSKDELGALSGNLNALYSTLCTHIESLREEAARVSALEQSKTHFLRAAGHELKTPIAALNGIVEGMIDDVGIYKDKERYLRESKGLIRSLALTVNEILDATRHDESNPNDEPFGEVSLREIAGEALANQQFQMQKKGLRADCDLREDCVVLTKEKAVRTALSNIISNAVKYANEQSTIAIRTEDTNDGVRLVVENDCPPIPQEHLSRLFEPFYSVEYSRDKQKSGTGLGLYIVKKNLDALGLGYGIENTEAGVAFCISFDRYGREDA